MRNLRMILSALIFHPYLTLTKPGIPRKV